MRVLIREGSVSKDLHALAGLLTERFAPYLCAFAPMTATRWISASMGIWTT
jgi:hypothetical protein